MKFLHAEESTMQAVSQLFERIPNLPSIPRVVQELIVSLEDADADIGALVKKVKLDQSLSARVLRLANSSYYGVSHKIGVIDDAIALIGLNALRTMVVTSGISGAFVKIEGVNLKEFWKHSLITANVARLLGRLAGLNGELAYTSALMHRIGQLLIDMAFPAVAQALSRQRDSHLPSELIIVERTYLSTDHCEIGAELARRWNFPAIIPNALRWYADPLTESACPYACAVNLSDRIALALAADHTVDHAVCGLDLAVAEKIAINEQDLRDLVEVCVDLPTETADLF